MIFNWPVVFPYNAEQFGSCAAQPGHTRCCSMWCLGLLSGLSSLLCSHSVSAVVYFPPLEGSFTFLIFHGIFLSIFMTLTRMKLLHHNEIAAAPCKIRRDERNWGSILYIVLFKHLLMIILTKHLETRLMMCWALQPRIKRLAWRRRCLGLGKDLQPHFTGGSGAGCCLPVLCVQQPRTGTHLFLLGRSYCNEPLTLRVQSSLLINDLLLSCNLLCASRVKAGLQLVPISGKLFWCIS